MSTRAQVRFATREDGVSFSEHPEKINTQFYRHSDGYPEGLGVEIAESIIGCNNVAMEIESPCCKHGDLEYIYYIWQTPGPEKKDTWISIFETNTFSDEDEKCIFVGKPNKLISKYKLNTNDDG